MYLWARVQTHGHSSSWAQSRSRLQIPTLQSSIWLESCQTLEEQFRGGAANFGFISITYHQYIFGLCKYILRLEISIFDRENIKNLPKFRINLCFWDIQSGRETTTNVGYQEIFSLSNILISPIDILIVPYDLLK